MPLNWIKHPIASTPNIKTEEDLASVKPSQVTEYLMRVKILALYRCGFPDDIRENFAASAPEHICTLLAQLVHDDPSNGAHWLREYHHAAEEISQSMGGYPRACLAQWKGLSTMPSGKDGGKAKEAENSRAGSPSNLSEIKYNVQAETMPLRTKPEHFRFFDLPANARDSIYRYLVDRKVITVRDWKIGVTPTGFKYRTEYDIFVAASGRLRRTTYMVSGVTQSNPIQLNIMLANRQTHTEASKIFYKQKFCFAGSGYSTLAFLHDRLQKLTLMERISMSFTTSERNFIGCTRSSIKPPPQTRTGCWRRAINALVHSNRALVDFELVVDGYFWITAPWQNGPDAIFTTLHLCQSRLNEASKHEERNFLQHVARLGGVNLQLKIEKLGWKDAELEKQREVFRKGLEKLLQDKTFTRPYLADDTIPVCVCRKKLLTESCIWDREGKQRRG